MMRQAADVLSTPAAMQIRYLDTIAGMARTANAKVVFVPGAQSALAFPDALQSSITNELADARQ